tara:strand:+ start:26568 stop:26744 length:177 start_codon:yes stop_codon:yes gene_type:complete
MVKLKTATKWLILKRFKHVIECLLHISGLTDGIGITSKINPDKSKSNYHIPTGQMLEI